MGHSRLELLATVSLPTTNRLIRPRGKFQVSLSATGSQDLRLRQAK